MSGASKVNPPGGLVATTFEIVSAIVEENVDCKPAGVLQETVVPAVQATVWQLLEPSCRDAVASEEAKFNPETVRSAPPEVGTLSEVKETAGAS